MWTDPPTFYVAFWRESGGGNRLRQTGYTFLNFSLEKGSNTPDQESGPPTLKTWLFAPLTGSARNRVLKLFDCGTRRRGYYPHPGLVVVR